MTSRPKWHPIPDVPQLWGAEEVGDWFGVSAERIRQLVHMRPEELPVPDFRTRTGRPLWLPERIRAWVRPSTKRI